MTVHEIFFGECREIMREMSSDSIHVIVTSPPYYNAREYSQYETYHGFHGRSHSRVVPPAHPWRLFLPKHDFDY
ncbi:MAG: hypothetical protein ACTSSI_18300 [Candidatus Helarchaeota archaeon]